MKRRMTDHRRSPTRARILVALAAGALATGAGAGVSAAQQPDHAGHTQAQSAQAGSTPAADLRAGLTALLQEHVYLAGIAVDTGVRDGLRSRSYRAAAKELDDNSRAVAAAFGAVYGDAAERQVLQQWRRHIRYYVAYTRGRLEGDRAQVRRATRGLTDFAGDFGRLVASVNPNLPADVVERETAVHGRQTLRIIDATVARSVRAYPRLQRGAQHMTMVADAFATAIAAQFPDRFPR
jgi:hypothetical protein